MSHSDRPFHRILACLRNIRGFLLVTSSHRMLPHRTQRTGALIPMRAMCVTLLLNVTLACAPAVAQTSYAFREVRP
jgi:hypothetical protein